MRRNVFLALLLGAAGTSVPLRAQTATAGAPPRFATAPRWSPALRDQLSVGYQSPRQQGGLLQSHGLDRPLTRQLVSPSDTPAVLPPTEAASLCPMRVITTDMRRFAPMPVARPDSLPHDRMPVARSTCVNPLAPR